jgi:hypothetical protein
MNVYEWYVTRGGTFFCCGFRDCRKRYRTMAGFRRHFRKKHPDD